MSPRIRRELLFLLACLHKDTTSNCIQWITEQVQSSELFDPRAVGFALGDASEPWQRDLLSMLASKPDPAAIRVFAYALWREQSLVDKLSIKQLKAIIDTLFHCMEQFQGRPCDMRLFTRCLELLLGLLRTRNSEDPKIRILLQPYQKITKEFVRLIDHAEDILSESKIFLSSRVQLQIQKLDDVRTPDLLYALRLYLTNDNGANAIHITSISDQDDEE